MPCGVSRVGGWAGVERWASRMRRSWSERLAQGLSSISGFDGALEEQTKSARSCPSSSGRWQASHAFVGGLSKKERLRYRRQCGVEALMSGGHASFGGAGGGRRRCRRVNSNTAVPGSDGRRASRGRRRDGDGCRRGRGADEQEDGELFWRVVAGSLLPRTHTPLPCPVLKHVVWVRYTTLVRR
jgi:hypothetical protein